MISLNASVEAAHAGGESGRAFRAIADEIRTLAVQSAGLIEVTKTDVGTGGFEQIVGDRLSAG